MLCRLLIDAAISIHTLTQRVTKCLIVEIDSFDISIHTLTQRVTNFLPLCV